MVMMVMVMCWITRYGAYQPLTPPVGASIPSLRTWT
jgi:hypothetical protein